MRYISTRGTAPVLGFNETLLCGLARDGGLYVPEAWPQLSPDDIRGLKGLGYGDAALRIMAPFVEDDIDAATFAQLVAATYRDFDHDAVAPLTPLGPNEWLMELFHGPTLAFKDCAMQLLGNLFDHVLGQRGERVTVVCATSGDTGSAAIEACRDHAAIDIFVLHPKGRVSEVQRRQMTTVAAANVHNIAIEGTFDDCQALVKALFNDIGFRDEVSLTGVNSINWARILGQIVYYFVAAAELGAPDKPIAFSVPTGNFGNVYAGYAASRMGLGIDHLVLVTNSNDILARCLESGRLKIGEVRPTLSPSMDIQVASNFERYLFELFDRDAARLVQHMTAFHDTGEMSLGEGPLGEARKMFDGHSVDDDQTLATIARVHEECGVLLDPHSAVAVAGGRAQRRDPAVPMVALATAHPAKFPEAVTRATGIKPPVPERLKGLYDRAEQYETLGNDVAAVRGFIRDHALQKRVA